MPPTLGTDVSSPNSSLRLYLIVGSSAMHCCPNEMYGKEIRQMEKRKIQVLTFGELPSDLILGGDSLGDSTFRLDLGWYSDLVLLVGFYWISTHAIFGKSAKNIFGDFMTKISNPVMHFRFRNFNFYKKQKF